MVKICGRFRLWWFSKHWLCRDTSAKRLPYFRQYSAALGRWAASSGSRLVAVLIRKRWQQVGGCRSALPVMCKLSACILSALLCLFPGKKKSFHAFGGINACGRVVSAAGVRFKIFRPYPPAAGGLLARCLFPALHPVAGRLHRRCCSSLGQLLCFRSSLPSALVILFSLLFFLKDKKRRPAHQVPGCRWL